MQKNLKKGFTLIELLVVIAIIGILSSVVIVSLNNARSKARDSARKSNAQAMTTAFALYASEQSPEHGPLEADIATAGWYVSAVAAVDKIGTPNMTDASTGVALNTYLKSLPIDSSGTTNTTATYTYGNIGGNGTYCLGVRLENVNGLGDYGFVCDSGGCSDKGSSGAGDAWDATNFSWDTAATCVEN